MRFIIPLLVLSVTLVHAKTADDFGPFELMSVLNESSTLTTMNKDNEVVQAFRGDSKLPKGLKLVVDKHFGNAPEGKYRVYPVPEGSEFNIESTEKLFNENPAFKSKYAEFKKNIPTNCKPDKAHPYKCLPYFYIDEKNIGTAPSLEVQVAQTAANLNATVKAAATPECTDCQQAAAVRTEVASNLVVRVSTSGKSNTDNDTDCSIRLSGSYVNCNSKDKKNKSWLEVKKMVCLYESSTKEFCPGVHEDLKRIEIISDLLGFDKRQMACMTLIESAFKSGKVCSSKGACGITQFLSGTANGVAKAIKARYKSEWDQYQKRTGGTPFPVSSVTGSNIRGGHVSFGLFAMGVYLRDSLTRYGGTNLEEPWKQYIQKGGNPRYLFHTQIAAYNWGSSRVDNVTNSLLKHGTTPYNSGAPSETRKYMVNFNSCMYDPGSWKYKGSTPSSQKAGKCNLNSNRPICR